MDYIWGRDLRRILAGANKIDYSEIHRSFLKLLADKNEEISIQVMAIIDALIERGVIPRDIHAANFIRAERSKRLYIVDFHVAHLHPVLGSDAYLHNLASLLQPGLRRDTESSHFFHKKKLR
jgi:hypothetical protein